MIERFKAAFSTNYEQFRIRLASPQSEGSTALLGLLVGLAAGLAIVGFRLGIDLVQLELVDLETVGTFEELPALERLLVPLIGGCCLAALFWWLQPSARPVGIMHVLQRLQYHEGVLPLKNLVAQFFGAIIALGTGQSMGREGPGVHIGAGLASVTVQQFRLPSNTMRALVASGAAAAIAASFNTPLAGVAFAMEVILMEYTIVSFTPVILAAVSATLVTRAFFGDDSIFQPPIVGVEGFAEISLIGGMGIVIGCLAALFTFGVRKLRYYIRDFHIALVIIAAAAVVGAIAVFIPEVLGMSYDTLNIALTAGLSISMALVVLFAKMVTTAISVAARIPGGLIGPSIVLGGLAGFSYAHIADLIFGMSSQTPLFVMLGMGAMMSAVLQAPLAGLLALLELTSNPQLILPAMLVVVSANLTAKILFKQESVFLMMLRDDGLDYRHDPQDSALRRVGVAALMNRSFVALQPSLTKLEAGAALEQTPQWIIVQGENNMLMPASDLVRYMEDEAAEEIDLLEIPSQRRALETVDFGASLFEARDRLLASGAEAVLVRRTIAPLSYRNFGVVLKQDIESGYVFSKPGEV